MKNCKIIQDLLPIYVDGLASEESQAEVRHHLKTCEDCYLIFKRMQYGTEDTQTEHKEFKMVLYKLQRKRQIKIYITIAIMLLLISIISILWYNGFFHIVERLESPDGSTVSTIFDCCLESGEPPAKGGFTIKEEGKYSGRSIYSNAEFQGLWWSLYGNYQVVSFIENNEVWLELIDYPRNSGVNLDGRLDRALYENTFFKNVIYNEEMGKRMIEFEFLQWSQKDESKMLIYFSYTDASGQFHEGYLWYDYQTGETYGEMEIEQEEKTNHSLNDLLH